MYSSNHHHQQPHLHQEPAIAPRGPASKDRGENGCRERVRFVERHNAAIQVFVRISDGVFEEVLDGLLEEGGR